MRYASPTEGVFHQKPAWLSRFTALFASYWFTGWLSLLIATESGVAALWLPSGLALAVLYRWSINLWPAVFLAAFTLSAGRGDSLANAFLIAVTSTLAPIASICLLRKLHGSLRYLQRSNLFYFFIAIFAGLWISAAGKVFFPAFLQGEPTLTAVPATISWWMSETLGVLLISPLIANISYHHLDRIKERLLSFFLVLSISAAVGLVSFPLAGGFSFQWPAAAQFPLLFATFTCVAWAALTFGLLGSAITTCGFCVLAIWSNAQGFGPFATLGGSGEFWGMWAYGACLAATGLMITAAHTEIAATHSKLGESTLEQQAQKHYLEAVLQAIPDLLFEIDRQGQVVSFNGGNEHHALSAPVLLGKNLSETLSASSVSVWISALSEADSWGISQGKSIMIEQGDQVFWYELSIAKRSGLRRDEDRFICLARDITKRVHIHQTDLANEQRFRSIFETTRNIAVQGYNRFHEVIFWNKASEDLYGYSATEAMGRKLEDLIIPQPMRELVYQGVENWHEKDEPIPSGELALLGKDGNEVWVYSNHVLIDAAGQKEMYCLDIDLGPQRQALLQVEQELAERTQVEQALRQSEQRLEGAQRMARVAHWSWDPHSDSYSFSPSMQELFSIPTENLHGNMDHFIKHFIHKDEQEDLKAALSASASQQKAIALDVRMEVCGHKFWLQFQADSALDGDKLLVQGTVQDITERKGLDLALAAAAADAASAPDFFVTILKALAEAIGAEHVFISLLARDPKPMEGDENPSLQTATTHTYLRNGVVQGNFSHTLTGTPCSEVLANNLCIIPSGLEACFPGNNAAFGLANLTSFMGIGIRDAKGNAVGILVAMAEHPLPASPQIISLLLIFADRIGGELRRAQDQEKIYNLAFFDPLTGLPNRRMLQDRLKLLTAQSERLDQQGALLFIDIDHFKLLNDTRGHHIGDQLLVQVAERISSVVRATDLAARLGGDEFVVVFDNLGAEAEAAALEAKKRAEELHQLVNAPYTLMQSTYHCTISIGVSLFKGRTRSIDDLLRHADVAMYQAKDSGRNAIRFFDPNMQARLEKRATIETDLRAAYKSHEQLLPYYQVQIDSSGKAFGAELLLRWRHPVHGMISPGDFIPVAEQTGLIVHIGRQVIEQACNQLQQWSGSPTFGHLSIAVNVSPIQFNQPHFVDEILHIVNASGINPRLLKLELTESSLLKSVDQSIEKMQELQRAGLGFSMDDFGIGYSSLSYLKRLPLGQLKIDQTFVRDIAVDPNDAIIARTIIAMAQNMNLQVIAEGVETEEQRAFLEQNGCTMFQGYLFGRPVPIQEFEAQLLARNY